MESKMDYSSKVREFIVENFLFGDEEQLKDDTSFFERGIIDSTGILELIGFLEETYGVTIQDDELVPENFDNLNRITQYLDKKLGPTQS